MTPDELPVIGPYIGLGGWLAVLALVAVSWARGWLYSSTQVEKITAVYERLLQDKDKQIADWREAYLNSDARGDILAEGQRVLVEAVKTNNSLIQSAISGPSDKRESIR